MGTTFATIEAYIAAQPVEIQDKLQELTDYILSIAPKETTTAISYQMPTFRYNGNLFHFALNKKHIGLYPGPAAIEACKHLLDDYKCTKGAIQIPIEQPIPKKLIKALIAFNVAILQNKKGPNWHAENSDWQDAYEVMENIIVSFPQLNKEHKWGNAVYTYKGKNTVAWHGFKDFFSIWFYNGVFMNDPLKVLIAATDGKTKSLRQWRFKSSADMHVKDIELYIQDAIQTIDSGHFMLPSKQEEKIIEDTLQATLISDKALKAAFESLTLGKRNDYITYIEEAKQQKTKESRIEKIKPLILAGKGLHDKYKK